MPLENEYFKNPLISLHYGNANGNNIAKIFTVKVITVRLNGYAHTLILFNISEFVA